MPDVELTIKGEISSMRLRKGDILVVSIPGAVTEETSTRVNRAVRRILDASGLSNEVLVKPADVRFAIQRAG